MNASSTPQLPPPREGARGPPVLRLLSAWGGGAVWLIAPLLFDRLPRPGSLEHGFLFMPLVLMPLALLVLEGLSAPSALLAVASRVQPLAALLVCVSFALSPGPLAAGLTVVWALTSLMVAAGVRSSGLNLNAARVFLVVGAMWLLISRLGAGPRNLGSQTVMLAALHFHFSGFLLQILVAATGRRLRKRASPLASPQRHVEIGAVLGIPLIAAGNLLEVSALKLAGVAAMSLSCLLLALNSWVAAKGASREAALRVSSASLAVAMLLAGAYGAAEAGGGAPFSVATMVATHGLLNALGFTLLGLVGNLPARELAAPGDA